MPPVGGNLDARRLGTVQEPFALSLSKGTSAAQAGRATWMCFDKLSTNGLLGDGPEWIRHHSCRKASIGLSDAARRAGKKPNTTPIAPEIRKAMTLIWTSKMNGNCPRIDNKITAS